MELMNKVAELERLLRKPIYVNPKRTKAFKWVANIDQVTLGDLRESIFAMHQPQNLRRMVQHLPLNAMRHLYPFLFGPFQKYVCSIGLVNMAIPIGNEASKSRYVCAYLVAVANLFEYKFKVRPEKNVSGPNGHGPVDFALVLVRTSRIIGITEVKDKDFLQGIAQNSVQCELAALSNNKKKSLETENLICITEDKPQRNVEGFAQNIKQLESLFQTNKRKRKREDGSKLPFSIEFSEDALVKESVEYQTLRNGVKKVLGVLVGLLKDRACAEDDSLSKKKASIEEYRSKK
ncbi:hypothetical protein RhiirA4_458408 [Rhizophagus irregularis]|uniref:Uncharacterized protein n=1 Tax=Rhizophagus irregularis TaxID=588596 RepID=A0A2I1GC98_9GLOM|nr:hypothetical protein RhiirA4_458408 [Rhizophagus irregularis]